jgi:hypothetical protein
MGFGIHIHGRVPNAHDFLKAFEGWVKTEATDVIEGLGRAEEGEHDALFLQVHPAAEDVLIVAEDDETVAVSGLTSTAGPGYHKFLCDWLDVVGKRFGITWDASPHAHEHDHDHEHGEHRDHDHDHGPESGDATGYFDSRDRAALEAHAASWLEATASRILELATQGHSGFGLSLPEGVTFVHDALVSTPLGPRDLDWVKRTAKDGREGFDVFPWPRAERDATFYRNRALVHMWLGVHWRRPMNEEEVALLESILEDLEKAYHLDGALDFPWREWAEIQSFLGRDDLLSTRTQMKALSAKGPLVGYRRNDVIASISGGWSVVVPGEFAENWDEHGTWSAWTESRSVWITSFSSDEGDSKTAEETLADFPPLEGEIRDLSQGGIIKRATFSLAREGDHSFTQMRSYVAMPGEIVVCTVCIDDPHDEEWALGVLRSIAREEHV